MDSLKIGSKSKSGENLKRGSMPVPTAEELEVKRFLNDFAKSIRAGEIDEIMSFYARDLTAFDMMPPLKFEGLGGYRRVAWEECFTEVMDFPITYEWVDQKITVRDDLAFAHSLIHMTGSTKKEGKKMEAWLRSTIGLQLGSKGWLIFHEHNSAPSDKDSGQVLMNLKPYESAH